MIAKLIFTRIDDKSIILSNILLRQQQNITTNLFRNRQSIMCNKLLIIN
jgi:hypothetical protein